MEELQVGRGQFHFEDPDDLRDWMREHKPRGLVSKLMTEQDAIARLVSDGDYLNWERFPHSLIREVVRQKKQDLWLGAKFSGLETTVLVAGGCASKIDIGWVGGGRALFSAIEQRRVEAFEWANGVMSMRLHAGSMGVPFIPIRWFGGTDNLPLSGARLVNDPYSGKPICLLPALNPDVSLIHVPQCDRFGNARIFGTSIAPTESAMASKKVIISAEEIISEDEVRAEPFKTTIPYYLVDAVVEAPFGAFPSSVPGYYRGSAEHAAALVQAAGSDRMDEYLDRYVYGVGSHREMLEKIVGLEALLAMRSAMTIKEGYR
jgi:acyl CoA:acetate/3-ketoacid CoA transferase alpha subunit